MRYSPNTIQNTPLYCERENELDEQKKNRSIEHRYFGDVGNECFEKHSIKRQYNDTDTHSIPLCDFTLLFIVGIGVCVLNSTESLCTSDSAPMPKKNYSYLG